MFIFGMDVLVITLLFDFLELLICMSQLSNFMHLLQLNMDDLDLGDDCFGFDDVDVGSVMGESGHKDVVVDAYYDDCLEGGIFFLRSIANV